MSIVSLYFCFKLFRLNVTGEQKPEGVVVTLFLPLRLLLDAQGHLNIMHIHCTKD